MGDAKSQTELSEEKNFRASACDSRNIAASSGGACGFPRYNSYTQRPSPAAAQHIGCFGLCHEFGPRPRRQHSGAVQLAPHWADLYSTAACYRRVVGTESAADRPANTATPSDVSTNR